MKTLFTRRYRKTFLIVFSIFWLSSAYAQVLNETVDLGDRFLQSGQLEEALFTYQRAAFYSPKGADSELLLKIADCFGSLGDFERAVEYLDHAYFSGPDDSTKTEILLKKANSFIHTSNYHFALIELLGMNTEKGSLTGRRKSLYAGASYYGLEDYQNAQKYFLDAVPENDFEARTGIKEIFSKKSNFYRPDPSLAMWMSVVIPGSGQLYAGDLAAALNSFILTGSLIGLTFYLTSIYHPIDAILTALPWFQRYYQGGFDQARIIAEQRRDRKRKQAYNDILNIIGSAQEDE